MTVIVDHLTKLYGTQKAVDDISFEVNTGEIVGFLGPNGAGKSTTMKIISCFTLPTSGKVTVNGFDIFEQSLEVRKNIGYLPEQNPQYEDMYVREYLLFISRLHGIKVKPLSRVEELIQMTGLNSECHKKIGELSKGYRQRVGLAQALIHNPGVLLLDEPTSGLDPNQVVEIRNLIIEIGRTRTIILSSHIMQEVQAMCNRVIIINKGKIVADNKTEAILSYNKNKTVLRVAFKNPVDEKVLMGIKGVEHVGKTGEKWLITAEDQSVMENIFNFAASTSNPLLELSSEGESLEKVFQKLTGIDK